MRQVHRPTYAILVVTKGLCEGRGGVQGCGAEQQGRKRLQSWFRAAGV